MVNKRQDDFCNRKRFKADKKLCAPDKKGKLVTDSSVEFSKELDKNCKEKKKPDDDNGGC